MRRVFESEWISANIEVHILFEFQWNHKCLKELDVVLGCDSTLKCLNIKLSNLNDHSICSTIFYKILGLQTWLFHRKTTPTSQLLLSINEKCGKEGKVSHVYEKIKFHLQLMRIALKSFSRVFVTERNDSRKFVWECNKHEWVMKGIPTATRRLSSEKWWISCTHLNFLLLVDVLNVFTEDKLGWVSLPLSLQGVQGNDNEFHHFPSTLLLLSTFISFGGFVFRVFRACLSPSRDMRCEIWRHSACRKHLDIDFTSDRWGCVRDTPEKSWGRVELEIRDLMFLKSILKVLLRISRPWPWIHDTWQQFFVWRLRVSKSVYLFRNHP